MLKLAGMLLEEEETKKRKCRCGLDSQLVYVRGQANTAIYRCDKCGQLWVAKGG